MKIKRNLYEKYYTPGYFGKNGRFYEIARKDIYKFPCTYCGEKATHADHVFPISVLAWLIEEDGFDIEKERLTIPLVPACQECNLALKDVLTDSINKRKRIIRKRLQRKYKKILSIPEWTDEEISCKGPGIRSYIKESVRLRNETLNKLESLYGKEE